MKQIEVEKIIKESKYEAIDGTLFSNKDECVKYENSAKVVLLAKYNKLVVKSDTEYNIFHCGSDDCYVDLVKVNNTEDIKNIMQLFALYNPHTASTESNVSERMTICEKALHTDDILFVHRGYEDDSFWIESTLGDKIDYIKERCKYETNKA